MIVKIKEKKEIAKGTLMVTFDSIGAGLEFEAGQFCKVKLINPPYMDNRGEGRFLGFTTSPSNKDYFSVVTRLGVSAFKKSLVELPIGTEVEIGEIGGRVNKLPEDKNQQIVFVSGGIGIAPVMGILRYCRENLWPYKMTLLFSNKDRESAPFFGEIEEFTKETDKFRMIATMTDNPVWTGEKRRIDTQFIKEYLPEPEKNVYAVTGTPRFVPTVFRAIQAAGVPVTNLKMEIFTGY